MLLLVSSHCESVLPLLSFAWHCDSNTYECVRYNLYVYRSHCLFRLLRLLLALIDSQRRPISLSSGKLIARNGYQRNRHATQGTVIKISVGISPMNCSPKTLQITPFPVQIEWHIHSLYTPRANVHGLTAYTRFLSCQLLSISYHWSWTQILDVVCMCVRAFNCHAIRHMWKGHT